MVIDKRLHKTSYTGKYVRCRTFSGRVERFPQCCMTIHTLYYIGLVDICVLRKPLAQILIVQLKGVKRCTNQEIKAWQRWNGLESMIIFTLRGNKIHTHSSDIDSIEANVVTTRGATRKHQQRLQQEQNERITSSPQNTRETSSKFSQPVKFSGIEEMDDRPQNAIPEGSQSTISARDIHLEIFTTISDNSQKVNTRNQKRVRNQWIWFPRGKTAKKKFPSGTERHFSAQLRLERDKRWPLHIGKRQMAALFKRYHFIQVFCITNTVIKTISGSH